MQETYIMGDNWHNRARKNIHWLETVMGKHERSAWVIQRHQTLHACGDAATGASIHGNMRATHETATDRPASTKKQV